ncbi:helicase associated domain-containing protein [Streptomyces sp. KL116D]|uniref:helicase associated domain-containing protein n=1 Tax=Streptomyces sp. KL116D TaxID=3045152 RepID=UPI003555EBA1
MRRTQDDKWMLNLAAARRFHAREGHLQVPPQAHRAGAAHRGRPRRAGAERGADGVPVALGMWLANTRRRADKLSAQRRDDLDQLGMRW